MKNLSTIIGNWFDKLDEQWQGLPVKKQCRYTLLLFAGYALLTLIAILNVYYHLGNPGHRMTIAPIKNPMSRQKESPVLPQDSIATPLKHKTYER